MAFKNILAPLIFIFLSGAMLAGAADTVGAAPKKPALVHPVIREDLRAFIALGADIDGVWGPVARLYGSDETLEAIRDLGFSVSPVPQVRDRRAIDDYPDSPEAMGQALLDQADKYPDLCRVSSIGQSPEGRDLWMVCVSDNPDLEEDEPEALYVGGIHGDEPTSTFLCLKFISLLLENYGADQAVTDIVNNLEIWVMPLMNPDGYANNSRYTIHNNYYEDLNRSFPDRLKDPVNTVKGRPVETRVVMEWVFNHSPVISASFHAGALVVNYPFDADPDPWADYARSPDDALFIAQSETYAALNPPMRQSAVFDGGITNGLAWYEIHGGMQDWLYVWHGCNQLTIEVSDIKTLPSLQLDDLWEDNRNAMLTYLNWSLWGIRGLVTDRQTRTPVAATIRIADIDHDSFTDPDAGDYHRMLLPGVYDLVVKADGYYAQTVSDIVVGDGPAARVDILLDPLKKGDVNGDGDVGLIDAILSLQVAAGIAASPVHLWSDVNGDQRIGMAEAIYCLSAGGATIDG